MANEKNLKPFNTLTEKEQRELAVKGGKASAKKRKEQKLLKDTLLELLTLPATKSTPKDISDAAALSELKSGLTVQEEIAVALVKKAKNGDLRAIELLRDTIGQKPVDKQITQTIQTDPLDDESEEVLQAMKEQLCKQMKEHSKE